MNIEILSLTEVHFKLIKITLNTLGKFRKFDTLRIHETKTYYEICTFNKNEKFVTRTIIGKLFWKVLTCHYQKAGEEEIKIK